jgi:hypothetical protein
MLDLADVDIATLVEALQDQSYEHKWLIDPATGEVSFYSDYSDEPDFDLDDTDLIRIDPVPSREWYLDMADFAEGISDDRAGRRLGRAIQGRGAFRRFKDELHDEYPELLPLWYEFSGRRGLQRAVEWLAESGLIDRGAAARFLAEHPDIELDPASAGGTAPSGEAASLDDAELGALLAAAMAGGDSSEDQLRRICRVLEDRIGLPFTTEVLGMLVSVDRLDVSEDGRIVAVCSRGAATQAIGLLELPLPASTAQPAEIVAAYRRWIQRGPSQ